ncbi:tRNA adenosine(34) deaminase TadA [Desulfomarina sp.]
MGTKTDAEWMRLALKTAVLAEKEGEVPVGAVLVKEDNLIATGRNGPRGSKDPTAHAEIIAIRKGATIVDNYRLTGTTLYVTLEPCIMCMGALIHARIDRLVFGATDPKTGAAVSRYAVGSDGLLNHTLSITGGVLEAECSELLKNFFITRRKIFRSNVQNLPERAESDNF